LPSSNDYVGLTTHSPLSQRAQGDRGVRRVGRFFDLGTFAQAVTFTTVPRGRASVRTIVTATHTEAELPFALECFERAGTELGLVP
jgi:glycine C-acetyltransferase